MGLALPLNPHNLNFHGFGKHVLNDCGSVGRAVASEVQDSNTVNGKNFIVNIFTVEKAIKAKGHANNPFETILYV